MTPEEKLNALGTVERFIPEPPKVNGEPALEVAAANDETRAPEFSDDQLALDFADLHRDQLRYVAAWSHWFLWTGTYWRQDETLHAFDLARSICREAGGRCNKPNESKALASSKTVAAVVSLARADRRIAATADQWDADPWLLNTPDGVVDLRTGMTRPHSPGDYMTKITAVSPGGACPLWRAFLHRVTGGDDALAAYLQRLAGYSLTGVTTEHALAFLHGLGANGKSVWLSAITGMAGAYAVTAPIEMLQQSAMDRHPAEIAALRGARLVSAVETEEHKKWAEARIKILTGGDKISARFMRGNFFEFIPQFTLIVVGNHKPGLRTVDEAIRRRFHLVPFNVVIPPEERDPDLGVKLKAEWSGILSWAIQGCLAWQKDGLAPPPVVASATASYLESEDALATWIDERCDQDPNTWTSSSNLFASWKAWADQAGEYVGSSKRFVQAIESRGYHAERRRNVRGFVGLQPRTQDQSEAYWNR